MFLQVTPYLPKPSAHEFTFPNLLRPKNDSSGSNWFGRLITWVKNLGSHPFFSYMSVLTIDCILLKVTYELTEYLGDKMSNYVAKNSPDHALSEKEGDKIKYIGRAFWFITHAVSSIGLTKLVRPNIPLIHHAIFSVTLFGLVYYKVTKED